MKRITQIVFQSYHEIIASHLRVGSYSVPSAVILHSRTKQCCFVVLEAVKPVAMDIYVRVLLTTVSEAHNRTIHLHVALRVSNAKGASFCLYSMAAWCSLPFHKILVRAFVHSLPRYAKFSDDAISPLAIEEASDCKDDQPSRDYNMSQSINS
jgi:hypothetical protein